VGEFALANNHRNFVDIGWVAAKLPVRQPAMIHAAADPS
jgi:hypothetical protein